MSSISADSISRTSEKRRRFPRWSVIIGVLVITMLAALAIMALRMNDVPRDLDTSTNLQSEQGGYKVSYQTELNPIPINQIQSWTIRVTQPDGQPVEDATITVEGGMPQHGHGLPTAPRITDYLGDGVYRVEGLKFNMPGWWVVSFEITREDTTDTVTFNLILD